MSADNWGHRARFGIFIVGAEVVPEAEWWAMAPRGVSIHAARVTAKAPWAAWDAERISVTLSPDLERGADQFASMALDAVTVAHSSSSVLGGDGWDAAVTTALQHRLPSDTIVTTNGADCALALEAVQAKRPLVVFPPWFGEDFAKTTTDYMRLQGIEPAGTLRNEPEAKWATIAPSDLYANGMHLEQRPDLLLQQIASACPDTADSVLLVGTGLRCVSIIEKLEAELHRPVVTANQASLWRCLQLAGVNDPISGYGRLLSQPR